MKKNTKIVVGSLIAVAAIATGLFASNSSLLKGMTTRGSYTKNTYCGVTATELKISQVTTTATTSTPVKQVKCLEKGKTYFLNAGFYTDKNPGTSISTASNISVKWESKDPKGVFTNMSPEKNGAVTQQTDSSMITHLSVQYTGNEAISATLFGFTDASSNQYYITSGAAKCVATVPQCK